LLIIYPPFIRQERADDPGSLARGPAIGVYFTKLHYSLGSFRRERNDLAVATESSSVSRALDSVGDAATRRRGEDEKRNGETEVVDYYRVPLEE